MTAVEERSYEVERALVSSLMLDRDAIAAVVERMQPEAFAHPWFGRVYRAILACWERRVPADLITVQAALDRDGGEPADVMALASLLLDEGAIAVHAPYYADLVVSAARERAIQAAGLALVKQTHDGAADADAVWRELQADLARYGAVAESGPQSYADLIPAWRDELMAQWEGAGAKELAPTGFPFTDQTLNGGFRPGELVILGARPGMGKTAYALQLAHQSAKERINRQVLIFSAEMNRASLLMRAASWRSGLSYQVVGQKGLADEKRKQVLHAARDLEALPVLIDDESGIGTDQMQVRIERAQQHGPVGLVVFDYLELAGDAVKGDNEERRVGEIVRRLKHIAMTCRVPLLSLSQLNRSVESRTGFVPKLADLRYSGAIEANADIVLLLYRYDYYVMQRQLDPLPEKAGTADVIVAKHRNGAQPTIKMRFHPETMSFEELGQ